MARIPGTFEGNGDVPNMQVPPDLVWDENDPPIIHNCSQHIEHQPRCNGRCGSRVVESELQVKLMNEARAWARLEMPMTGVPMNMPFPGVPVEMLDLLCWLEGTKEVLVEQGVIEEFEFQEKYREKKLEILTAIRENNEGRIKRARMGVPERPPIIGPDGTPLM